ncbi:MAG: hypothetical protein R2788_00735 [Saprospiraceae bacterium]
MKTTTFIVHLSACYRACKYLPKNVHIGQSDRKRWHSPIGVTVMEEGTSNGTITDVEGDYSIVVNGKKRCFP